MGVRPVDGRRGSIVRLPEIDYQGHSERPTHLAFPGAVDHLNSGHVDGKVVVGRLLSEPAGTGDHCCRRIRREARVGPNRRAGDTPLQKARVPGPPDPRVDRNLAGGVLVRISLSGGWKGGWSGRGRNEE